MANETKITVHEITNGLLETVGWAVIKDGVKTLAEFDSVVDACVYAKTQEENV